MRKVSYFLVLSWVGGEIEFIAMLDKMGLMLLAHYS
jgi:hypothetical protein